jgi:fructose-1,6-bisphosphatase I
METECVTVTSYVLEQKKKYPHATGELTILLNTLLTAIKACAAAVRKAGIAKLYGLAGSTNTTGDDQKKLDVLANELFINMLKSSYTVYAMASEENENMIEVEVAKQGKYIICFDPLDGSSNIDCLVTIGSIFGIWKKPENVEKPIDCLLQSGEHLRCAGYAVYGSACMLVLATPEGVNGFTLDPSIGEFILTSPNIQIPKMGEKGAQKIYSINEGYAKYWDKATTEYVHSKKFPEGKEKPFANRYVGSMVADVHRTILYGGVFMYPATKEAKEGKIRLLYESIPMAYVVEKAGGASSNGQHSVLKIQPQGIHQRSPVFLGYKEEIEKIEKLYEKYPRGTWAYE